MINCDFLDALSEEVGDVEVEEGTLVQKLPSAGRFSGGWSAGAASSSRYNRGVARGHRRQEMLVPLTLALSSTLGKCLLVGDRPHWPS